MAIITDKINYLWLDTETTGLDSIRNDVIRVACIAVVNGVQHTTTFNQFCQPFDWTTIDAKALEVNNISIDKLMQCLPPITVVDQFVAWVKQFNCKFTIAGYNADFDKQFLSSWFKKANRESEYNAIFNGDLRDLYKRVKALKSQFPTPNVKLATLCAHFGIEIKAHDALSDITATIALDKIISEMLGDVDVYDDIVIHNVDQNLQFKEPVQLHCHSKYSHVDSLTDTKDMVEWCLKNKTPGFSFVDHTMAASLFDMIKIPDIIKGINKKRKTTYDEKAVVGVPGMGLYVSYNGQNFFINAWATSNQGYRNLVKLSSKGWSNRVEVSDIEFPLLPIEELFGLKEGIVFGIPGVNGPATHYIVEKRLPELENLICLLNDNLDIRLELAALDVYKRYDSAFGFMSYNVGNIQKAINGVFWLLAKKHNIKMVPVSDSHFLDPNDKVVQDCICKNSYKDNRYFFESRHQTTAKEMYTIIKSHINELDETKFNELIENTYEIADKASSIKIKHEYHLPKIEIPENIKAKTSDYNQQTYFYMMQKIKEHGRWNNSPEYVERFKKEVDVIMKNKTLNFLPYFLVYEDVCAFARSSNLLQGIARGSAGGSLLSYYLKIIHVDPVATFLPFERFLSHARINAGSFPDIDLDIAGRARPMVMKYLQEKYGMGFAQIATFQKMKTKNAIKDSMYALYGRNRKDPEVAAICDSIPDSPQGVDEYDFLYGYTDQEGVEHKGQVQSNEMLANFFNQRPEIETMVKKLIGAIRQWSRHASAFVISTLDLSADRVPTMIMDDKDLGTIQVTQYEAGMVEKSGLVKADILGIKTLTMASDAMALILKNHGVNLLEEEKGVPYVYRLPDRDEGVFGDFYKKDTDSSFQFNTSLIKGFAQEFCPLSRADLAAMTALCRPGALDAPLYDTTAAKYYMDVRNGKRDIEYLHSDLEPILKNSNGVFVYQEEVMWFLVDIVGYTWEESDLIRSAIAKKKHEVIMATFTKIRESLTARGWDPDAIETICQQIQAFSRYSFNKSHSYAYGELGYITLWLKHHYPLEWWCGVLNNEDDSDKVRKYIVTLGDKVSPPSLKNPAPVWTIVDGKIVAPLASIKSVGPAVVNELVKKGPFASLEDYVSRVDHARANIGAVSAIIRARAADDLMDSSIPNYLERRQEFMRRYLKLRKSKTEFKPELVDADYMTIFLDERDYNGAFNKSLLTEPEILKILKARWPGLNSTGNKVFPLTMGKNDDEDNKPVYIVSGVGAAETIVKSGIDIKNRKFGLIGLFQASNFTTGISKKSGRQWKKLAVDVSDGYNQIECVWWDQTKALRFTKNTIIYVEGELDKGWKTPVTMKIDYIEEVK